MTDDLNDDLSPKDYIDLLIDAYDQGLEQKKDLYRSLAQSIRLAKEREKVVSALLSKITELEKQLEASEEQVRRLAREKA